MQPRKLLSRRQLADIFQVTVRTIDRWRRLGVLPPPIKPNGGKVGWLADEIEQIQQEMRDNYRTA